MKKYIYSLFVFLSFSTTVFSQQSVDQVLKAIEQNNSTLKALIKHAEAEKIGTKTDIFLANPEVEFAYLWGNPSVIGNRKNLSITQSFDFPTSYKFKNQIADLQNTQLDMEYRKQQKAILLQGKLLCYDLIYTNALLAELGKRFAHAQSIAKAYQLRFDKGESNLLELNKALLNRLNLKKKMEMLEVERGSSLSQLAALNGGVFIDFTLSAFDKQDIPKNFDQWYVDAEKSNPLLNWLKQEVEINQKQEQLHKAQALPKFHAGYMSEALTSEQFRGLVVGLSVPLWENKNKVKYAQAQTIASQTLEADYRLQFLNHISALHAKAIALDKNLKDYQLNLNLFDSSDLLLKALEKGELSLIDYMIELSIYYDSFDALLEMEKDLNSAIAELNQFM